MNRRQFAKNLAGAAGMLSTGGLRSARAQTPAPDPAVRRVLVMFKCHLDIGFVDTQAAIIQRYFTTFYPRAIEIAETLKKDPTGPRYTWTTGSWMLYHYLEQAKEPARKRMEQAITDGDIAWHALPFTWQTELLEPSFITGAIGFSKSLDQRFGRKTTGAKMTDVPGHSRGIIRPLTESGVTFLNIGVNSASTPPDVPPLFRWKDPDGASIVMMYHRLAYGGVVLIPGSDLAVAVEVADDNYGPHTPEEITAIFADLRRQFPSATVQPASLTDIANAVEPHKGALPELPLEIGDTWIHGIASDPAKLATFRQVQRLRSEWIGRGALQAGDKTDLAFLSQFSLAAEHTWGTDTKTWLDFDHYTPAALLQVVQQPKYRTVTNSWREKRADIENGINSLPAQLRAEARQRLLALRPVRPATAQMQPYDVARPIETEHYTLALDAATGAITTLRGKTGNRDWASPQNPLAAFTYQTFSKQDYDNFLDRYITVQTDWAPKDFGKPNIEKFGAESRDWNTKLVRCVASEDARQHKIVAQLQIENGGKPAPPVTAWPTQIYLTLTLPKSAPVVNLELAWLGKRSNRLPEALWLTFRPNVEPTADWQLNKTGGAISPFDVVQGGNRHMHALSTGLSCKDSRGTLAIETLDAPLVALGDKSPIYFSKAQPDLSKGIHFNLFNNGWGTNYVQWFGEDMLFRFSLRV